VDAPRSWVIGASGLLGSALRARLPDHDVLLGTKVPWQDPASAVATLERDLARFRSGCGRDDRWTVYWAAGAGVIGSDPSVFERETATLAGFVAALARDLPAGAGAFFLASSASVYAGSPRAPFTESTRPAPRSTYAEAKRGQEVLVSETLSGRLPHVIGRISTLYGPGQDLTKSQGLVSKMCLQAVRHQSVSVFVPLDTLRDYLYAGDAAALIRRFTEAARAAGDLRTRTRVVCHGSSLTIGELTARVRAIGHRRIGLFHRAGDPSPLHVRDLRLGTEFDEEIAGLPRTPISTGIHAVYSDVLRRLERGELA
jgi:UDP-glucose 4-epimerase